MSNIVSNSKEAFEALQFIKNELQEGRLKKEVASFGTKTVKERGHVYNCRETNEVFKDMEGNLKFSLTSFKDANSDYNSFYIDIHDNGFIRTI